jgi:hypothetical protein
MILEVLQLSMIIERANGQQGNIPVDCIKLMEFVVRYLSANINLLEDAMT